MEKFVVYHDLRDALQHGTCPVCSLVEQRVDKAIKVILREGITDSVLRGSYIQAKGYCNYHAWQMREAGDPVAHAYFYRGLLEEHKNALELYMDERKKSGETKAKDSKVQRIRAILQSVKGETAPRTGVETSRYLESFSSDKRCPLCELTASCESRYVEAIADYFESDEEFKERYSNRGVLCHPHLRRLIQDHSHRDSLQELLEIQLGRLDTYIDQLTEIERKASYMYSDSDIGPERGSWIRAVHLDVGIPGTDTSYKTKKMFGQEHFLIKS